jgi:glucose/arabinose dehydrogenase
MRCILTALFGLITTGCFWAAPSKGGGEIEPKAGGRVVDPTDIAVLDGYVVDVVATGLTFPTSLTFDEAGALYVVEAGYVYGEKFLDARLLRVEAQSVTELAKSRNGPWTGVVHHAGAFYVAEGGQLEGGRILRIDRDGKTTALVEGLPSLGDHHTNGPAIGKDGYIYFGQGSATNSGVVGTDNAQFGWLERNAQFHDVPCQEVTLTGANFETGGDKKVSTGAFLPYGTASSEGQVIPGQLPCSGALMRVPLAGGKPELVAWGFRNPFGLAFAPDGALYVTDNGYDERGSRPVFGAGDVLWRVQPGSWYGWPDYADGHPIYNDEYQSPGDDSPARLLAVHPGTPPRPVASLAVHSSSDGFDFSRNPRFGFVGQAFIAEFGDQAPVVGKTLNPVGFKIIRVDLETGVSYDFAVNAGKTNGPASMLGTGGLERPIAVRFSPGGEALYIVDFGVLTMTEKSASGREKTGVIWRIRRAS